MSIKRVAVLVLAGMVSFAAIANEEAATTDDQASVGQSNAGEQPGLFDGMADDVLRSLGHEDTARQTPDAQKAASQEHPDQ